MAAVEVQEVEVEVDGRWLMVGDLGRGDYQCASSSDCRRDLYISNSESLY